MQVSYLLSRRAVRLLVVASVARPVVELNYKDMGAPLFLDNLLWPLVVYYARGLKSRTSIGQDGKDVQDGIPSPGPSPGGGENKKNGSRPKKLVPL